MVNVPTDTALPQIPVDPLEILVAIPTLNEEAHIARTLTSILRHGPLMADVKIVVADGGSKDATRKIVEKIGLRHPNVHLIDNPEQLQAAAINRVVEQCAEKRHSILVRVDAHSRYPSDYVLAVANSLRTHEVAALATVMDSVGDNCFQRAAAVALETELGSGGSGHRGGTVSGYVAHGHHAGFDLRVWRDVGGYDPTFTANEDAELDHRIGLAGGRIWLDATIRLDYVMRPTLRKLALQYWRYGLGRAQTVQRHRMRLRARQMIPILIVVIISLALVLAPFVPIALFVPIAYGALLAGTALYLAVKHHMACALWAGLALAAMHLSWGAGFLTQVFWYGRRKA